MLNETMQELRAKEVAMYIVEHNSTIRQAAKHFGVSKSTVHQDIGERLWNTDVDLYHQVRKVIQYNISQRAIRGGEATKRKFKGKK